MKIVVDMMGSDLGSSATCQGVELFIKSHPDVELICVGKETELSSLIGKVKIINAPDVVLMTAGAMEVLRAKNSSMMVAINEALKQDADAIVSAGSTGGFLSATTLKIKLIEGVERAAIVSPFPTAIKGQKAAVLDIGASNENTADQLVQFALMGRIYARAVFKKEEPAVYLLSNGSEDEKGTPEIKEAHRKLKEMDFPGFKGNVEAREALDGRADVIVTGGFAGNIFLKATEGIAKMMSSMIKKAFKKSLASKIGYLLSRKGFKEMSQTMDYKSTGGAMLLGINMVAVKAHGNSDAIGFNGGLEVAYKMASAKIVEQLKEGIRNEGR
ncbi:MAG TPA: phosphate acyltransferase PlsX [Bacilli bacterium]|nr:phosphate acyltransferase PlsX [Bacilli bacterium]